MDIIMVHHLKPDNAQSNHMSPETNMNMLCTKGIRNIYRKMRQNTNIFFIKDKEIFPPKGV